MDTKTHVVMYSGGLSSFETARRVIAKHGTENVVLLFTDTKIEDEDLYRFLNDTEAYLGVPITRIADGRTPWQVYKDVKFLGNSRIAPCSHILKQKPAHDWIVNRYLPNDCILYLGIDWSEQHRAISVRVKWKPYKVEFPLFQLPFPGKHGIIQILKDANINAPRLYDLGFEHNNCGGFCCRAGQGHFAHLHEVLPERFAYAEQQENVLRQSFDADVAILKRNVNGVPQPYTLTELRTTIEASQEIDVYDIGGCGCFSE